MLPEGSVTQQIGKLKTGDHAAAFELWRRYFQRLVDVARRRLQPHPRGLNDEEDVALAAFAAFCRHAEQGGMPEVRDRDDLWRVLVTLTVRSAIDEVRRANRQKRGGAARAEGTGGGVQSAEGDPDRLASPEPTPEFLAQVAEECQRLISCLDDETLRSIAQWKTEGYTNEEIGARLGVAVRTVERKLQAIREQWSSGNAPA
jgi:RNA polymerase sigma factor (sigma-70 family)